MHNMRGSIFALEGVLLFTLWMMLLAHAWGETARLIHGQAENTLRERAWGHALALSDRIIRQHGATSWRGCAVFSLEKRRTLEYRVSRTCLQGLGVSSPFPFVKRVRIRTMRDNQTVFENPLLEETECADIERPIIVNETHEKALVEVMTCET